MMMMMMITMTGKTVLSLFALVSATLVVSSRGFVVVPVTKHLQSTHVVNVVVGSVIPNGRLTPSITTETTSSSSSSTSLFYSEGQDETSGLPASIESPVLKQLYPKLLEHKVQYGHPNIPLGSSEGRQCDTLRRLHIQQKLSPAEEELLTEMGFRFHSLEDVYGKVDFDELFQRLEDYEKEYKTGYQVPKKFVTDPELGAWVTGIRRLGPAKLDANHTRRLNEIGFAWKSNRKCGSKFMMQYRIYRERLEKEEGGSVEALLQDDEVINWLTAQKRAKERGALSETRTQYLDQLFGTGWRDDE